MPLLNPKGGVFDPVEMAPPQTENFKKAPSPVMGEAFGQWAGRDVQILQLPGAGVIQFDLNRLTLGDFRQMTSHYQVNSSLSALSFMIHQLDWHIECSDKRVAEHVTENLTNIWTRLVRAMSQAFWAGYSPNVLQWENIGRRTVLTKIKDLLPEEAEVHWKEVEGATMGDQAVKPKIKIFDGIKQAGVSGYIPQTNSFWYPLLMENGNYKGRKLLKAAFQPWYFSTLIHLYSNRYFERFGEPLPVGRAPFDEMIRVGDTDVNSNDYMAAQLQKIRSRAVAVLPSDRPVNASGDPVGSGYDYEIEYLESQMRGADFERYLTRLDEEISLALFTPLLLVRAGESALAGSTTHLNMYLWQLNALAGDWGEYIDKYILAPMADLNFGVNSARPKIKFRKLGTTQGETVRAILAALVKNRQVNVDLVELGQAAGLSLEEAEILSTSPAEGDDRVARIRDDGEESTADKVTLRVAAQAKKAFRNGTFGNGWTPDFGHGSLITDTQLNVLDRVASDLNNASLFTSADAFMEALGGTIKAVLDA